MRVELSIVIPIFNEQEILERQVEYLRNELRGKFSSYEIILSENGSTDNTKALARELDARYEDVIAVIDDEAADYGEALVKGINRSSCEKIVILELDYLDMDFAYRAYDRLGEYDLVVGSKKISHGIDQRPLKRKILTAAYNMVLAIMFRQPVTETHGLKALNKSRLLHIVNSCVTKHAVYPTELVLKAWRDPNIRVCEVPLGLVLQEIRTTRITPMRRLKKTYNDLKLLKKALDG